MFPNRDIDYYFPICAPWQAHGKTDRWRCDDYYQDRKDMQIWNNLIDV